MAHSFQNQILGTWALDSFEIEDESGTRSTWGANSRGLLIYASTGHMSVSINKDQEPSTADEANAILDSILFYAGSYQVEGNLIRHQVTLASSPHRIGKEMIRYAELAGNLLTLTTPKESFGRAILVWKKVGT